MASKTIQIRGHGQITIPKKIRDLFDLKDGDVLVIEEHADGILIKPRKLLDPSQAWFWSEEWQERERAAAEDIKAGNVSGPFKGIENLREHLERPHA